MLRTSWGAASGVSADSQINRVVDTNLIMVVEPDKLRLPAIITTRT
jgi:hypothetical protein